MRIMKSLKSRIIVFSIGILTFSLITTSLLIKNKVEDTLSHSLENNANNLLETIKINIESEYRSIMSHNQYSIQRRKSELKNHVDVLYHILDVYEKKVESGELTIDEAKDQVLDIAKDLTFDNGTGYYWIFDTSLPFPTMINHTTIPNLNGQILDDPRFNCVKNTNENLFVKMIEVCTEDDAGYVEYLWPKPTEEGLTSEQPKISFVKLFKTWNWIIGTGVYVDDILFETNMKIQEVVNNLNVTISKQMVSESGYCFIFGEDNFMYVHPYLANRSGDQLINPSTSNKILDDIKNEYNSSKTYMEYLWDRIDDRDNFTYPKKVYFSKFEPLNWYICVSVYKYDFEKDVRKLTKTIFFLSLIFLGISLILAIITSRSITKPLNKLMNDLEKTDKTGLPGKIVSNNATTEISTLSRTINEMVLSVQKSRKALKNERDFSMGIITGSPDIICGFRHDGTISFINPEGEFLLEYDKNEIIGRNWWEMLSVNNDKELGIIIDKITNTTQHNMEIRVKTRSGKKLALLWNSIKYRDIDQEFTEIFGICNNISERKAAEEKLHYFQKYLTNIIDSMPSIIVGVDHECKITQLNQEAENTLQHKSNETIGLYIYDVFNNLGLSRKLITETIDKKKPTKISKKNVYFKKEYAFLDITIYPLISESYEGAVIRVDDISDRVKLEEMMIQSEKMLSIGGLAAGMAHEINNPIAGMLQNAIVLENKLLKHSENTMKIAKEVGLDLDILKSFIYKRRINKHLELIHSSGKRAAEIITNMLSFARKSESRFNYVIMSELIDSTVNLLTNDYDLKKKYDFRKIKITMDIQENLPKIKCEETKIQQVLINILRNGAEAMSGEEANVKNPEFKINIFYDDSMITTEIENNGPTIPLKIRKRIFEPFFTTKNIGKGTGLGLSVSYFIITKNHNGEMWVECEGDFSTKFVIKLPYTII